MTEKSMKNQIKNKIIHFFEAPISPIPLGIFRICMAGFTLLQALLWYPDWLAFFGEDGWVQWEINTALANSWQLQISKIHDIFLHRFFHTTEEQSVMIFYWCYVVSALGLLLGIFTRFWAFTTWFLHFVLMSSIPAFTYGVDIFLHIGLFYQIVMPVAKAYSLDLYFKRVHSASTWGSTFAIRVLQIHLSLAYFSAGYEKMLVMEWWNGTVLWRAMVQPDFRQLDVTWMAHYPFIPMVMSWFTMILETFYFIGMQIPKVRFFWLMGMIGLHLGIGLFLGLWLFGLVMILLSISAFGYAAITKNPPIPES